MTQIDVIGMVDMIYCEASLWEILFDILILILNGHACPAHGFLISICHDRYNLITYNE